MQHFPTFLAVAGRRRLARAIEPDLEERLPVRLGLRAAKVKAIRGAAEALPAGLGSELSRRGLNPELRVITKHDVAGFAERDWASLARPGSVAAIYMAKRGARFLQGRLLMFGAAPDTPVTIVENASRPEVRHLVARLGTLSADLRAAALTGPAVLLYGIAPAEAAAIRVPSIGFREATS